MMLVAGGPGQGSASVFNLSDKNSAELYRVLFPGYRIVAFDNRGTGKSGLLLCSALQSSTTFVGQDTLAAGCAATIGPNRDFYSTHDHADDTEAVRVALGVDKIALWGTSYGTKLALAYALAYPTHVERLLLDSVLPTDYPEPLEANVLHDMPLALSRYCPTARAVQPPRTSRPRSRRLRMPSPPSRLAVLVRLANGKVRNERMDGLDMLALVVDSDLNPGLAAMLPAATHAARLGRMGALLRLHYLDLGGSSYTAEAAERRAQRGHVVRRRPLPVGSGGAARRPSGEARGGRSLRCRPARSARSARGRPSSARPRSASSGRAHRRDAASRCRPAARRAGALAQWWLRHAHADLERGGSGRLFPHGKLLVVPAVGHSVVRRGHIVLRDPRRALLGHRRERARHLPAAVLPRHAAGAYPPSPLRRGPPRRGPRSRSPVGRSRRPRARG